MTNAVETERAPELNVQPSVSESDPPEPAIGNSQVPSDVLVCIDRLRSLCPDAFTEAKRGLGEHGFWPAVLQTIEGQVSAKGYGLLADMLEFAEAWQSDTATQADTAQPKHRDSSLDWNCENLRVVNEEVELMADTIHGVGRLLYSHIDGVVSDDCTPLVPANETVGVVWTLDSVVNRMRALLGRIENERRELLVLHERDRSTGKAGDETPAVTTDLGDVCRHVDRIEKLVQAAAICEDTYKHGNDRFDGVEFRDAISGSIGAARDELGKLQVLLNGGGA